MVMTDAIGLTVYNPGSLSDTDFLRGFVARQETASELIDKLIKVTTDGPPHHFLVLGQRGMGKTSMLRKLALSAQENPQLSKLLIPLTFREEQYNVHSSQIFWSNCLDALGDWFDKIGEHEKANQLDREVAGLKSGQDSQSLFDKWIRREQRRPLLLLDNIDLILNGLKKESGYLEKFIPTSDGLVIVGGSATSIDAICESTGDLHSAFEVCKLGRLTKTELIACLRRLALARGSDGEKVVQLLSTESARIKTLHDLTGGNPRTLTILYMLLETNVEGDVFGDLERLLDQSTVLYKARVEDLPPQSRVVLDAVALAWDPIIASSVATTSGLDVTSVSSHLDRLQKEGILEKVTISTTTKSAFQVTERFFNIWYLMRHGARRQRSRLKWLTVFLKSFYSNEQLIERAKSLVNPEGDLAIKGGSVETGEYLLALSNAIDDEGWRSILTSQARDEFENYAISLGRTLNDIVDPTDVPLPSTSLEWIRHGNLLRQHLKSPKEAVVAFRKAIDLDPKNWSAWFNLGATLLGDLVSPSEAVAALKQALTLNKTHLPTQYILGDAFRMMGDFPAAKKAFETALKISPRFYLAAIALGDLYSEEGNLRAAAKQYALAGKLAPTTDTEALHAGGFFVAYVLEEFDRSLEIYRRLADRDPKDHVARTNIAVLELLGSENGKTVSIDDSLLRHHSIGGQELILTFVALAQGNRFAAMAHAEKAFSEEDSHFFDSYRGFILLLLRKARREGWADMLLKMFDETGATDKNWPLQAAFDAFVHGEQRLLDVNPEVRSAAQKIFKLLNAPESYKNETEAVA